MRQIAFREALREAMNEEMRRDNRVFLMGEEVAEYNGAYKVSQGMLAEFGAKRIIDTPISELGFSGIGVGAAQNGLRPIIEFMTWNFAVLALDQILNTASKMLAMSGGQLGCPIVFRGANGSAGQLGAQHSTAFENMYANIPGLKVVSVSNGYDAKGLLKQAIRYEEDPVMFMESEVMYGEKSEVPEEEYYIELGKADIKRQGTDVTIVSFNKMMKVALGAAAELEKENVSAEVIDLRTIRPLDWMTVLESVKKTNRLVIVAEEWPMCGDGMTDNAIKDRIAEYLISCPVYRYYDKDIPYMSQDENSGNEQLSEFYSRAMQFTGPLMAKGVEDTLMYTYNRFIGHNEVGDAPQAFGLSAEKFHGLMEYRKKHWPLSLNTTSTHDTKRGEDARARLNALTDFYEEWTALARKWRMDNESLKKNGMPDGNDEYFIYQTLIATYPHETDTENYKQRISAYLQKALREAKTHTDHGDANTEYEHAAIRFAHSLINGNNDFHKTFMPFLQKITDHGMINSLSQLILKFTCPGIPDTYQGTELWDLSLVDPDNRSAVDYSIRKEMIGKGDAFYDLWKDRKSGHIKLALLQQLLQIRSSHAAIFSEGTYLPLQWKEHLKARRWLFCGATKERMFL